MKINTQKQTKCGLTASLELYTDRQRSMHNIIMTTAKSPNDSVTADNKSCLG